MRSAIAPALLSRTRAGAARSAISCSNSTGFVPWTLRLRPGEALYPARALSGTKPANALRVHGRVSLFAPALLLRRALGERPVAGHPLPCSWTITIVAVPIARYHVKRLLAAAGLWRKRVLIAGAGESGVPGVRAHPRQPPTSYEPVGFVRRTTPAKAGPNLLRPRRLEPLRDNSRWSARSSPMTSSPWRCRTCPRERLLHLVAICEATYRAFAGPGPVRPGLGPLRRRRRGSRRRCCCSTCVEPRKPWNRRLEARFRPGGPARFAAALLAPPLSGARCMLIGHSIPAGPLSFVQGASGAPPALPVLSSSAPCNVDNDERLRHHLAPAGKPRRWKSASAKLNGGRSAGDASRPRAPRRSEHRRAATALERCCGGDASLGRAAPLSTRPRPKHGRLSRRRSPSGPPGINGPLAASAATAISFAANGCALDDTTWRNWSPWMRGGDVEDHRPPLPEGTGRTERSFSKFPFSSSKSDRTRLGSARTRTWNLKLGTWNFLFSRRG